VAFAGFPRFFLSRFVFETIFCLELDFGIFVYYFFVDNYDNPD
jgi:hypothetical protein